MAAIRILTRGGFDMLYSGCATTGCFGGNFAAIFTQRRVLPSGRLLAGSLARYVGGAAGPHVRLEVGPGTGAVAARIVGALRPGDTFDMVGLETNSLSPISASDSPAIRGACGQRAIAGCASAGRTARPGGALCGLSPGWSSIIFRSPRSIPPFWARFRGLCAGARACRSSSILPSTTHVRWSAGGTSAFACAASGGR